MIILESETTLKIKAYSTDERGVNAYEALLAYYGKHGLHEISESQGQAFLAMLRNGDVRLTPIFPKVYSSLGEKNIERRKGNGRE